MLVMNGEEQGGVGSWGAVLAGLWVAVLQAQGITISVSHPLATS